ncbi:MAG: carboxypeptidase-like regulatory domain-containing protein [Gemmatimonadales bacterium]
MAVHPRCFGGFAWPPACWRSRSRRSTSGQGIRGRVVDSTTGLVVPDANVRLIANDGRVVGATRSDDQGLYRLVARDEGWYQVEIRRVGYRPLLAGPFRLGIAPSSGSSSGWWRWPSSSIRWR